MGSCVKTLENKTPDCSDVYDGTGELHCYNISKAEMLAGTDEQHLQQKKKF